MSPASLAPASLAEPATKDSTVKRDPSPALGPTAS